jgi:hypothetical protein
MLNEDKIEEREYSFNWLSLFVKVIAFAVLLVLLVWVISLFTGKKCETITNDYYAVSYFTDNQYKSGLSNNIYQYRYTIKLLDITPSNSKDITLVTSNYFHSDEEYNNYLNMENSNLNIINQSDSGTSIDSLDSFVSSSLTASNFTFELSDIYQFEDNYYLDVTLNIGEHSSITSYSNVYFVPIHISIKYTETNNCKS